MRFRLPMICAALGASLMATGAVGAADLVPQDFAYARQIETPDNATIYRVALPLDVYKNVVRSDLGDLRVFNASGKAVPYALRLPLDESTSRQPARLSAWSSRYGGWCRYSGGAAHAACKRSMY